MPNSNYGIGRYVAAEGDVLMLPHGYPRDGSIRGVVYVHAFGEVALSINQFVNGLNKASVINAIASVYPTVSFDGGAFGSGTTTDTNSWGNPNAQTRLGQAITWLQSPSGGGAKTGQVLLVGYSMGHALSLTYAQANPQNVAAIVGMLPVNDIDDIRDNNRGTFRASISTAWGTGAWTAPGVPPLPANANPAKVVTQPNCAWLNIPQLLIAANDDQICTMASCIALATAQGQKCQLVNTGNSGGHTDTTIGVINPNDVLTFLARYS
jgi:dienelactone hydrolase